MKKGFETYGKYSSNPIGSEGRSASRRKSGRDPGLTPSEKTHKAKLMRQFMRNPEGTGGASEAYVSAPCWCDCGRLRTDVGLPCARCTAAIERVVCLDTDLRDALERGAISRTRAELEQSCRGATETEIGQLLSLLSLTEDAP